MMIQKVKYHVIICTWKLHYQVSRNWEREVCFCLFWWHYFSLSSFSQPSTWEMTWDSMIMKPMKTQSHTTDAMPKTHDKNFLKFLKFFLFQSEIGARMCARRRAHDKIWKVWSFSFSWNKKLINLDKKQRFYKKMKMPMKSEKKQ